jgi:hypothetical protein
MYILKGLKEYVNNKRQVMKDKKNQMGLLQMKQYYICNMFWMGLTAD